MNNLNYFANEEQEYNFIKKPKKKRFDDEYYGYEKQKKPKKDYSKQRDTKRSYE